LLNYSNWTGKLTPSFGSWEGPVGRSAPDWPRLMRRGTAAAYIDVTPTEFDREVAAGRMPLPVKIGNADHWSRAQLDEHIASLLGEHKADWRAAQPLYAA
jgi:hypothetical protein